MERGFTSLEPRPKPAMTLPSILYGKGDSGPESGPTMEGRVVSIVVVSRSYSSSCLDLTVGTGRIDFVVPKGQRNG